MNGTERFWDKATRGPRGVNVVDFDIIPSSTALTIIDMQKYGCCRDLGLGPVYLKETPETAEYWFSRLSEVAVPNIRNLLQFFRKNKLRVIHVCVGPLLPDASDMIPRRRRRDESRLKVSGIDHFFSPGTLEHEIVDELKPNPGEMIFNKNTASAFNSTNIDQILRNMGIEGLVITGMATSACVESTARDAADKGYNCILVENACADRYPDSHKMTMINFARAFGQVMTTSEIINHLESKLRSKPGA